MGNGALAIGPKATAPILNSTDPSVLASARVGPEVGVELPMARAGH